MRPYLQHTVEAGEPIIVELILVDGLDGLVRSSEEIVKEERPGEELVPFGEFDVVGNLRIR